MSRIRASNTSEITTRISAARSPLLMLSRIARQFVPLPDPRMPSGTSFINDLSQLFEQTGGRIPMHKWEDTNVRSDFPKYGFFFRIQRFGSVITTLGINGRPCRFDQSSRVNFGKNRDEIDELQRGEDFRTITFVVKRTPNSFQGSNGSIAIQTDCQSGTERTRRFQTTHMTPIQQIEPSVRNDQFFPSFQGLSCAPGQLLHIV